MSLAAACEFCGKIFSFENSRRDRRCCSNSCSVRLNYAKRHNFLTPYQRYIGQGLHLIENRDSVNPILNNNTEVPNLTKSDEFEDSSVIVLREAEKRFKEYNNHKL